MYTRFQNSLNISVQNTPDNLMGELKCPNNFEIHCTGNMRKIV